jgi:hypothetical protein
MAVLVIGCAHEAALDGAWRSVSSPGTSQREIVHVYKGGMAMIVFEGQCGPVERVEIEAVGTGEVAVRFLDDAGNDTVRRQYVVEGETLYVPVRTSTGLDREAFQRVEEDAVLRQYECVAVLLER